MVSAFVGLESNPVARGERGVIATSHPLASSIGLDVLKRGGNAVDAAIAASFALGVVEPYMSGIGGGCFVMLHLGATGEVVVLDARGVAPAAATEDMFVRDGKVQYDDTAIGHRSVLIPGLVAGLATIHESHGSLPLAELVEPAARVADEGYVVTPMFVHQMTSTPHTLPALRRNPEAARIYLKGGEAPATGARVANPDLGRTYRLLGAEGAKSFYRGAIATAIAQDMRAAGGLITEADLAAYQPRRQTPVTGEYGEYRLHSLAPPSSGGIFLVHSLNMLADYALAGRERYGVETLHLLAEVMKRAFSDRAHFVGDPNFVEVPLEALTSVEYAAARRATIDPGRAGEGVSHGDPNPYGGFGHTTHLCVADRDGNVVGITQTVGSDFGSGVVVPGTGIVLNHLMGDFSPAVGAQTAHGWGTFTSRANAIAPGKTPTSSNSPVIVTRGGRPVLASGAAGGSRIPSTVLQVILNVLDFDMDVQTAIAAVRVHDQGEGLEVEKEVPLAVRTALAEIGHRIVLPVGYRDAMPSRAQGVALDHDRGTLSGGADPRTDGLALAF